MFTKLFASAAILASIAKVQAQYSGVVGSAIVDNQCDYSVNLWPVPGSTYTGKPLPARWIPSGQQFSMQYVYIDQTCGWSIKLSKTDSFQGSIMQYEYTWLNDSNIWFDASNVNGNPWNGGQWSFSSDNSSCVPEQIAYQNPNDNAASQRCDVDASITVTLCSGSGSSDSGSPAPPASSPVAAASTTEEATSSSPPPVVVPTSTPAPTTVAPTTATPESTSAASSEAPVYTQWSHSWNDKVASSPAPSSTSMATPTTFATSTSAITTAAPNPDVETVVDVVTAWETVTYTAQVAPPRRHLERHAHHPRHAHFRA